MLLAGLFMPAPICGQKLSIGVVGGLGLTNDHGSTGTLVSPFNPRFNTAITRITQTSAQDFIIGPKIELTLPGQFSFEVEALHRKREYRTTVLFSPPLDFGRGPVSSDFSRLTEPTWDVPLLIKYQLPKFGTRRAVSPFIEAGPSLRPWLYRGGSARIGFTAGARVRLHLGSVNIEPAIRYTRWGVKRSFFGPSAKSDQIELLAGISHTSPSLRPSAFGQKLSIGVVGGFGLSGDFPAREGYASARSKLVGVMLEFGLPKRLSIEWDGLYRPLILSEGQRATVLTWEFPLLVKYRFSAARLRPFAQLGPSFRATGNLSGTNPSHYGVTSGAGVEARMRGLIISPAVRFTLWMADPKRNISQLDPPRTIRNQAELLVGFSF